MKHCSITFLMLSGFLLHASLHAAQKAEVRSAEQIITTPAQLIFDQQKMIVEMGWKIEGYWASSSHPERDTYKGKYPFPKANEAPWPGQQAFIDKLKQIEKLFEYLGSLKTADLYKFSLSGFNLSRGSAPSRLDPEEDAGHGEYFDGIEKVRWTFGFGSHYVQKFNVKPSQEFYEYVMNFNEELFNSLPAGFVSKYNPW